MKRLAVVVSLMIAVCPCASAQPASPRIGPFVIDLRGTFPNFPTNAALAESRGIGAADLPGVGIGVDVGAHVYLLKWRAITFGVEIGRAHV